MSTVCIAQGPWSLGKRYCSLLEMVQGIRRVQSPMTGSAGITCWSELEHR